jgi:hypothetical protein
VAAHLLAAGIINTTTDFILVLLPMVVVFRRRELTRQQIVVINILFGIGLVAGVAGAVRTYYTWIMTTTPDFDTTWHGWPTQLSSTIELNIGIVRPSTIPYHNKDANMNKICASIPATKPFFSRFFPRIFGSRSSGSRRGPDSGKQSSRHRLRRNSHDSSLWDSNASGHMVQVEDGFGYKISLDLPKKLYTKDLNKPLPVVKDPFTIA